MNRLAPCCIAAALVALASPFTASAQEAYARGPLNLRAGPSNDYPLVARLAPRQPFDVIGCTRGYGWCDIVLPDGLRGWAYAGGIEYDDGDRPLPLAAYGAAIGVPIIGFTIGNYWRNHYRDRSWYGDRRWWGGRPPPPPAVGWRPPPPERPHWRPQPGPGPGPGYRPGFGPPPPGPGFRPDVDRRPEFRPPPDRGVRPPHPGPGVGVPFPPNGPRPPDRGPRPPQQGVRPPPPQAGPPQAGVQPPRFVNPNGGYAMPGRGPTNHQLPLGDRP